MLGCHNGVCQVLSVSVIHNGVVVHASIPEWGCDVLFAVQTMVSL